MQIKVEINEKYKEAEVLIRTAEMSEERLDQRMFVRISNSEIINLRAIKKIDLSFSGTICITLQNAEIVYVSRRYMTKIKRVLGIISPVFRSWRRPWEVRPEP